MFISRILIGTLMIAPLLAACSPDGGGEVIVNRIWVGDGNISVRAESQPDATISRNGELSIDAHEIALSSAQKTLLKRYYADALQLRTDGKDVGVAGANMGGAAIGSAITGLLGGDPDETKLKAGSRMIQEKVAVLCEHLADLKSTQQTAGETIAAFQPYAQIEMGDCRQDRRPT